MPPIQKNQKNNFVVDLHKDIYKKSAVERLIAEDKDWVKLVRSDDSRHFRVQLATANMSEVLEWVNYLFFLNKTS